MKVAHSVSRLDSRIVSSSSFLAYRSGLAKPYVNSPFDGCNALSLVSSDLRRSDCGSALHIFGYLVDVNGLPFPNTGIEVWHLTPFTNEYNNRAIFYTSFDGYYEFVTNLPERTKGKNYEVYFRIKQDDHYYYTKLIFNHTAAILSSNFILKNKESRQEGMRSYTEKQKNNFVFQFDIELLADR